MAYYAALVSLMGLLEDIIHDDLYRMGTFMKSLHEKLSFLEESLKDYLSRGNEDGDHLEDLIKDAADRAEDSILSMISKKHNSKEIQSRWSTSNRGFNLKKVEKEFDSIEQKLKAIKERQNHERRQIEYDSAHASPLEQRVPSGGGYSMVGFDKYKNTINEQLCGQSSKLQVISIVGAGGIGKTTLARNTFDQSLVMDYFDYRAWTTVSQDYRVKDVLNGLMKSLGMKSNKGKTNESNENDDESVLKERLYKFLKGRRFLIIVDDIWSTKAWDDLKRVFPDDYNGSRIMLTTRLMEVAEYADASGFVHEIQLLSEKDSWDLLRNKVFGQDCCPTELENTGMSIASECYGLPLAIVVIAGVLSETRIKLEWEEIASNVREIFSKSDGQLSSILSLSYNHLPHQLKACFLHMGSFPEDYAISVSNLTRLWVAEGLLHSPDESKNIETFGEECLEDLVKRNLVLVTKKTANGKFKLCVLHDLLRDFCREKASSKYFFYVNKGSHDTDLEKTRRCILHGGESNLGRYPPHVINRLRSLTVSDNSCERDFAYMNWDRFKKLRILRACEVETMSIPEAIFRMFHLRYLELSLKYVYRPTLSPQMSALQNLQTLVIHHDGTEFGALPPEIWKLTKLRHLIIHNMLLVLPVSVDGKTPVEKLECLQTLMTVCNFKFTRKVINMIPNLRKLKTHYEGEETKQGKNSNEANHFEWDRFNLNNLIHLLQLEELKVSFYSQSCGEIGSLGNGIAFPVNLIKLSLTGCGLPWGCMMEVSSLPNLQVLRLKYQSFIGEEWELVDGEFRRLKFLLLDFLNLRYWRAESYQFPCLEHLKIRMCNNLVAIPLEIGDIPTLKYIDIFASEGVEDLAIRIREEQEDHGNDMLQVRTARSYFS